MGYNKFVPHVHGKLGQFLQGPGKRKGVILPRSYFKTTCVDISYTIQEVLKNPETRILLANNTFPNASNILGSIKQQWERNTLLRTLFPDLVPTGKIGRWSTESLEFPRKSAWPEATIEAVGASTQVTSRHYNKIIGDDLVAPSKDELKQGVAIPDREKCQAAIGWHESTHGLAVEPKDFEIIQVGTRWASYDLINYLKKNDPDMTWFEMKAVENGLPTFPERFPLEVLERIKKMIGTYLYNTQYMNNPANEEDAIFLPGWITYYEPKDIEKLSRRTVIIVDLASSEANTADYNAICVVSLCEDRRFYLRKYANIKANPGKLVAMIVKMFLEFQEEKPVVWIEKTGYQRTFQYWFERTTKEQGLHIPTDTYASPNIRDAKKSHINSMQPYFETGRFLLPKGCDDVVAQLLDFPGEHDDIIDAMAWGPKKLRNPWTTQPRDTQTEMDVLIQQAMKTSTSGSLYDMQALIEMTN